ncbi:hypothetical protein FE844_004490 [Rhizobium indicum]|uniref:hypothetical protein n=1 Tax=Rhizobium indicum TaxID=2583231 RepID=UPI00110576C3|nr:hypothetical protein [Rhizobium indicum]QKK28877.1 hypothetical protein FE844_004490 [Rhizobium indicum]
MQYGHNLVLIMPLLSDAEQQQINELSYTTETLATGKVGRVSIMGTPTSIAAIVCTLPEPGKAENGAPLWTPAESAWINRSTYHMLSIIRLTWDDQADFFKPQDHGIFSASSFSNDEKPTFFLRAEMIAPKQPVDAQLLATSYAVTSERNLHHIMDLLSESHSTRIPSHYRFLALYKIIELEHPRKTGDFHSSMDEEFGALKIGAKPLRKLLPQLRVKIAHALATGATSPGLDDIDRDAVSTLIPIMQKAIRNDIAERHGLRFEIIPG